MIAFTHYIETPNVGDRMCAPYLYFDFGDFQTFDISSEIPDCEAVIYGGGAIEPKLRTEKIHHKVNARTKIGWGIGTSRRGKTDHGPLVDDLDLCGYREFGRHSIVKNSYYVPCVSCMSEFFDKEYEIKNDFVFYTHGHFSLPNESSYPRLGNRTQTLDQAIDFLASGETIVTNSFHGTYWGLLLGRKVVCIPFSSKFYGYKYPPSYCTDGDWLAAAKKAKSYGLEYIEDSRDANSRFYRRVKSMISIRRRAIK